MTDKRNTTVEKEAVTVETPTRPLISWGAIWAGLLLVVSSTWVMLLLGSAIGVSVADATDATTISEGFTIGTTIWLALSALLPFFLGSLLTARLAGSNDETVGILHGVSLWSLATVVLLVLTYWGVAQLVQTGSSLVASTANAVSSAASATGTAVTQSGQVLANAGETFAETELAASVAASLKQRAAAAVAEAETEGGVEVSQSEVAKTLSNLDPDLLKSIGQELLDGDSQGAKDALAKETNLSKQQIDEIIEGVQTAVTETTAAEEVQARVDQAAKQTAKTISQYGGKAVSQSEARRAVEQLDADTMNQVAIQFISGKPEAAKDTLAVNTSLSEKQINQVVEEVSDDVEEEIEAFEKKANQAMEAASTYSQAVLWGTFICAALGLAVSIGGGALGAANVRREVSASVRSEVKR